MREWLIGCRDPFGRRRALTVCLTEHGQVVMIAPPGEAAVLHDSAIEALTAALGDARAAAARLGWTAWSEPDQAQQ